MRALRLLLLLPVAAVHVPAQDTTALIDEARRSFQAHKWGPAAQAAQKALALAPHLVEGELILGLLAAGESRFPEAEAHLSRAIQIQPLGDLMRKYLGYLSPHDPRLFPVASILAVHGDYGAAIKVLEAIRRAGSDSYEVEYNLALAYFRAGNEERAAEIASSLAARHNNAEAYNLSATIEEKRGHSLEAVRAFQKAAQLEPSNEDYRFDYAYELLQHLTYDAAITIFTTGVRDFPKSWRMRLGLGAALFLAGKNAAAMDALLAAVKIKPNLAVAYRILGRMYDSSTPDQQKVLTGAFEFYLRGGPKDPWAWYHYAVMRYQQASQQSSPDFGAANEAIDQALRLDSDFAEALVQKGILLQDEGRLDESVQAFQRAIRKNPKLAAAHYRLGISFKRLGQNDSAKTEFALSERLNAETQAEKDQRTVLQFLTKGEADQ